MNGPPGATNAGQGQGTTRTTTLGGSAIGVVVDITRFGGTTTQVAALRLRQSGIQPGAFLAAGAAAAAGAHQIAPTAPPWPNAGLGLNLHVPGAMVMGTWAAPEPERRPGRQPCGAAGGSPSLPLPPTGRASGTIDVQRPLWRLHGDDKDLDRHGGRYEPSQ